ncbi:hypothetical protein KAS79_02055 [Candidatus Parcubacteria bacterium]|nr:hypothetical protein [Candidatus Parcubacteria bacterium]
MKNQKLSLQNELRKFVNSIINHPYKALVVVFIFWFLVWHWGFEASFFITLFFLFLLLRLDCRILIFFALLFLISCPFYLILGKEFRAEQMAIYAYYLLFIGVILALIECKRQPEDFEEFEKIDKEKAKAASKTEIKKKKKKKKEKEKKPKESVKKSTRRKSFGQSGGQENFKKSE